MPARSYLPVIITILLCATKPLQAEELWVDKACPVTYGNQQVGLLALSHPWYHSSRSEAAYIPRDNATGIGIEIHFFRNDADKMPGQCQAYRLLQVRSTTARLFPGELPVQVDIPDNWPEPFYDSGSLEHGRGTHHTPADLSDKPWSERPKRASTVALYDTPYVSDAYGIEGTDIEVGFETCVVCQRQEQADTLLSCGTWGYTRHYIDERDGWAEPVAHTSQCRNQPSPAFRQATDMLASPRYQQGRDWQLAPTNPLADGQFAALAEAQQHWLQSRLSTEISSGADVPPQTGTRPLLPRR